VERDPWRSRPYQWTERVYPTLADELRARAFDFDLQVQLCMDLDAMPVNDVTVEGPGALTGS
jgi:hypothetical protein